MREVALSMANTGPPELTRSQQGKGHDLVHFPSALSRVTSIVVKGPATTLRAPQAGRPTVPSAPYVNSLKVESDQGVGSQAIPRHYCPDAVPASARSDNDR